MPVARLGLGVGPASDAEVAAEIAGDFLEQDVQAVTPILGLGSVNQIFVAKTSDSSLVVRLCQPEDSERALAFYEKEAWCLSTAAGLGIPGPAALAVGRWDGRPYMLQPLVPGTNGEERSSSRLAAWRALGCYAKLIHSIGLDGFGESLADFRAGHAQAEWEKFVIYNLDSLTGDDELIQLGVYRPDQAGQIRAWFFALRGTPLVFGLNHGDLAPRNTIVDENGQVSLLDWGSAEAHLVPHYDFIGLLREHDPAGSEMQAFRQGYGMNEAAFARLLPELRSLLLLKEFDLTRWAIDRCPERLPEIAERARAALQKKFAALLSA
jgi:aminoglycoside phosphotransferase (APT) family kinase protein